MKCSLTKLAALSLACLGLALPACCLAAEAAQVSDVALARGGVLQGQVVDAQGTAMKGAAVSVWHENQQVAKTVADDNGQFSVSGLRGGVHQVVAGQGTDVYRLWTADAAPPNAKPGSVVISGQPVVRGQNGGMIGNVVRSPILWGALGYTAGHIIGYNIGIDKSPSSP